MTARCKGIGVDPSKDIGSVNCSCKVQGVDGLQFQVYAGPGFFKGILAGAVKQQLQGSCEVSAAHNFLRVLAGA